MQQSLLHAAHGNACTDASLINLLEAHGTGTALGDPIEASSARATVFSARTRKFFFSRRPGTPLLVAFCVAQAISTLIAIYPLGPLEPMIGMVRGKECTIEIYDFKGTNGARHE